MIKKSQSRLLCSKCDNIATVLELDDSIMKDRSGFPPEDSQEGEPYCEQCFEEVDHD